MYGFDLSTEYLHMTSFDSFTGGHHTVQRWSITEGTVLRLVPQP